MKKISPKIDEIVDNPVISKKAFDGCSFNSDDRQFLKRNFEEMHEWLNEMNTQNQCFIAQIIIDANNMLFNKLDVINENVATIRIDLGKIEARIENIENNMARLDDEILSVQNELGAHKTKEYLDAEEFKKQINQIRKDVDMIKIRLGFV